MSTQPVCGKCGGTGWIIEERANVSGAKACDCRFHGRAERLEGVSGIPPLYAKDSFENFVIPGADQPNERTALTHAYLKVKNYASKFPDIDPPGLLLIGDPGCGKTHLAAAAAHEIIRKGFQVWFCGYQELLHKVKQGYNPLSNSSDREAYKNALEAEVLLLDDLAANKTSDWVQDTINSIITHRCDHRKPLIATTNAPEPEAGSSRFSKEKDPFGRKEYARTLDDYIGSRARSRLFEMCTVVIMPKLEDYRIRKGSKF
jgi:DNA replication protein DnaC